ncbi:1,2-epoxyphenylacetyl-CoA isomerase [Alphaproteobacteria bacterium SO-S41]|nr:1,2-epoxyphenylacetyl-CoA isomerase [Alphaproteobacteria bacterium SO-S41]
MTVLEFTKTTLKIEDGVATLIMNDPPVMNAMGGEMAGGLLAGINELQKPSHGVRCVILTGEGRGFCTGANLSSGAGSNTPDPEDRDAGAALETVYHPLLRKIRNLKVPLITAVNGPAAGVGMSFALMGDMILASKSAFFLQAFRRIGLVPDGGSTWLLPRLVGLARAKELSLLGERLPAEKALEWGLINRVYDDANLMPEANKLAKDLASGPTVSLGNIRSLYNRSFDRTYEEQLDAERWAQLTAGRSKDFGEGVAAFLQKRPADFKGE